MIRKIAIICGAGIATSTFVFNKLQKLCKEHDIEVKFATGLALEADRLSHGADLIVATTPIQKDYGIPVVNGIPFLTGLGEEETKLKILELLKNEKIGE